MLEPNPVLKRLGFSNDDRVVIIHADDIGMCYSSVTAYEELWQVGGVSSGAVMVPCPWFPEAAKLCRKTPQIDLGVHLTLTSEWETYRWGPISTLDHASGLIDEEGFFHHTSEAVQAHGEVTPATVEIAAQVNRAAAFGIAPTHIDTHMGAVAHPKFMINYVQLGLEHGIPALNFRMDEAQWMEMVEDEQTAAIALRMQEQLEGNGVPLLDDITGLDLDRAGTVDDRVALAKEVLGGLKPGITHFIIHPAKDTPELRAITTSWAQRVSDYEAFLRDDIRRFTDQQGIQVIGYRALQDLMPAG